MSGRFRIVEHPADLGIEAEGTTPGEAFSAAAEGLISVIVDPRGVSPRESRDVEVSAADYEQLLVRWLSEVLWLYDGGGFVPAEFEIGDIRRDRLRAKLRGEPFDPSRHPARLDVKAVTYHEISVVERPGHTAVRVYLDI